MRLRSRVGLLGLAVSVTLTFVGATWPELNPLVARNPDAAGPAPLGCEESLSPPAAPRVDVAEIPEREVIVPVSLPAPPPSRSLREELDAAHTALVRNDRPAFDEHLRAARAIVEIHPAGAERSRAEEVVWALGDAAVLWDAQFASPFFDETSAAYTRASRYAGYGEAMRRAVFTDDRERRFYPAAESRDFVARIAAERLERLGVRGASVPPPRVARGDPAPSPAPRRTVSPAPSPAPSTSPRRTTTTATRRSPRRSTTSIARSSKPAAPARSAPSSSPDPSDVAPPAPAEPAPTAPPASASQASADAPASPVAGEPSAPPPAVDAEPAAPIATDSATTTAAPASPEPAPATSTAAPVERRSVIVPALLILIGLGVLIVLFRASK